MARLGGDPRCDARFLYCFFYCCLPRQTRRPCHRYCRLATPPWRAFRACVCSAHRPATPSASTTATSILTARRLRVDLARPAGCAAARTIHHGGKTVQRERRPDRAGVLARRSTMRTRRTSMPPPRSAYGLPIVVPDADGDGRARSRAPRRAECGFHAGPVRAGAGGWRTGIDLADRWQHRRRARCSPMSRSPACQIPDRRSARWRSIRASRQIFRRRSRHRHDPPLHARRRRARAVRSRRRRACRPCTPAAGRRSIRASASISKARPSTASKPATLGAGARRLSGVCSAWRCGRGRLYYAVAAGLRVWSVAILPDGSFGSDARVEAPDCARRPCPGSEISDITFDDEGRHAARRARRADRRL